MNYTQYLSLIENPVYKVKQKNKKKYKANDHKTPPEDYEGYQVWGSNGMDGGYAIEEPKVNEDLIMELSREERERDRKKIEDAEKTRRKFRDENENTKKPVPLKYGEFLRFDKSSNKWVSNKE